MVRAALGLLHRERRLHLNTSWSAEQPWGPASPLHGSTPRTTRVSAHSSLGSSEAPVSRLRESFQAASPPASSRDSPTPHLHGQALESPRQGWTLTPKLCSSPNPVPSGLPSQRQHPSTCRQGRSRSPLTPGTEPPGSSQPCPPLSWDLPLQLQALGLQGRLFVGAAVWSNSPMSARLWESTCPQGNLPKLGSSHTQSCSATMRLSAHPKCPTPSPC